MRNRSEIKSIFSVPVMLFILFWMNSISVLSQTPQDFFVGGANLYINGDTERAKGYVEEGLSKYPDDKKLQALKKAIEEDKKDKNQNQNQDKNQEQNKDQQKKDNDQQSQPQDKSQDQQQQKEGYISKEDAQRLLDALANDEKNVQEKVKEAKAAKARVRTLINW